MPVFFHKRLGDILFIKSFTTCMHTHLHLYCILALISIIPYNNKNNSIYLHCSHIFSFPLPHKKSACTYTYINAAFLHSSQSCNTYVFSPLLYQQYLTFLSAIHTFHHLQKHFSSIIVFLHFVQQYNVQMC